MISDQISRTKGIMWSLGLSSERRGEEVSKNVSLWRLAGDMEATRYIAPHA